VIKFPAQPGAFKQIGNSDVLGNIWSSLGLDLTTNLGRIRAGYRGLIVSDSVDLTNLKTATAFVMYRDGNNDRIWALAGSRLFRNAGNPNNPFSQDTTSGTPTSLGDGSDMELFNDAIYVINSTGGTLSKYDGTWTTVSTDPNGGESQMCVYAGRLYFSQGSSQICSVDLADALSEPSGTPNTIPYTLDLKDFGVGGSDANTITSIRASSNRIWITTLDSTSLSRSAGRAGKVFEWDGVSTQANKVYYLDSIGGMALIIKGDIPYVVDADGKLLQYNGREFAEVARLPVAPNQYLNNPTAGNPVNRFIHPRGITLRDGKILILINNLLESSDDAILENLPSGVWEYDETIGLYHKYGMSQWKYGVTTTRTDYLQNRVNEVGALFSAKSTSNSASLNGDLLFGARYYNESTTLRYGIFINDTLDSASKVAYLVTTKIDSQNVYDVWQKVFVTHKQFFDASDKIVLKYRTIDEEPLEINVAWTSTTQFVTSDDISNYSIGDEVEVTSGKGGGQIEHITGIAPLGSSTVVSLENPVIGASGDGKVRLQKWIPIIETNPYNPYVREFPISDAETSWIQLKCVMYFTGQDEVNTLLLVNKPQLPAV